jgi:hypothetical protein
MVWAAQRRDDDAYVLTFETEREAQAWINERTMPWEFTAVDLDVLPTNIDDAIRIANRLGDLSMVRATLIGIFRRRELDGGKAGAFEHPLMDRIEAEKLELEERLIHLI